MLNVKQVENKKMTTEQNINNVPNPLTEQDFNNNEQLKRSTEVQEVIVKGLRSAIKNMIDMSADDKLKEDIHIGMKGLSSFDIMSHAKLFNRAVISTEYSNQGNDISMKELIKQLITFEQSDIDTAMPSLINDYNQPTLS